MFLGAKLPQTKTHKCLSRQWCRFGPAPDDDAIWNRLVSATTSNNRMAMVWLWVSLLTSLRRVRRSWAATRDVSKALSETVASKGIRGGCLRPCAHQAGATSESDEIWHKQRRHLKRQLLSSASLARLWRRSGSPTEFGASWMAVADGRPRRSTRRGHTPGTH